MWSAINRVLMEKFEVRRTFFYAALLYSFLIPFNQKIATLALILWVLCALVNFQKEQLNKNKHLFLLPMLYVSYALGIFTSVSPSFTFLEYKLSLLAFPLLFLLHRYTQQERNKMLRAFVFGLLFSSIICFGMALVRSISIVDTSIIFKANLEEGRGFFESVIFGGNNFFGQQFSMFHQTIYFAMFLCAGIAILLYNKEHFSKIFRWILIGIFSLEIFLISNKAGFIVISFVFLINILTASYAKKRKILALGSLVVFVGILAYTNPRLRGSIVKVMRGEIRIDKEARYDFKTRILTWDAALHLIKEKPYLGYGIGDTQEALNRVYTEKGYETPLAKNYNAHNLFMQIWLENGLPGLLLLILIFVVFLKNAFHHKKQLRFALTIFAIFFINAFFESYFSRFSGVSFFAFFACYIFSNNNSRLIKN